MANRPTSVNATTIAKVLALSLFLGGSGVGYVYQKAQNQGLVKQLAANEIKKYELMRKSETLRVRLAASTSRARLELLSRQFGLLLRMPEPGQVITLPEPKFERTAGINLANQP